MEQQEDRLLWTLLLQGKHTERGFESLDEEVSKQKVEGVVGPFLAVYGKMWEGRDRLLEELSSKGEQILVV